MNEEQKRQAELARDGVVRQLGELTLANIEANAIIQVQREQAARLVSAAAEAAKAASPA